MTRFKTFIFVSHFLDLHKEQEKMKNILQYFQLKIPQIDHRFNF